MQSNNPLRRTLQIPAAAVVAEARPQPQHFFLWCFRQPANIWEAFEKSLVEGNDRRNARLLQHDFRQPDAVRIFVQPPRQFPPVLAEPAQQSFPNFAKITPLGHREAPFSHESRSPRTLALGRFCRSATTPAPHPGNKSTCCSGRTPRGTAAIRAPQKYSR